MARLGIMGKNSCTYVYSIPSYKLQRENWFETTYEISSYKLPYNKGSWQNPGAAHYAL